MVKWVKGVFIHNFLYRLNTSHKTKLVLPNKFSKLNIEVFYLYYKDKCFWYILTLKNISTSTFYI